MVNLNSILSKVDKLIPFIWSDKLTPFSNRTEKTYNGRIYVLKNGDTNAYKIGVTRSTAEKRSKQLQTGNPNDLTVLYEFFAKDAYSVESQLHNSLSKYEIPTGGDEWYELEVLDPLHRLLNQLSEKGEIKSTGYYQGDVDYLILAMEMINQRWVWLCLVTALTGGVLFLIWIGAFI
jgi:hypothetical protein